MRIVLLIKENKYYKNSNIHLFLYPLYRINFFDFDNIFT